MNYVERKLVNRLNIVDVASHYLHLKKVGENYFAHCPFHTDHTPSFCVNQQRRMFHCFSCQRSGNVVTLVMEVGHHTFSQAIKILAPLAHVKVKGHITAPIKYSANQRPWAKANRNLARIYHHLLVDTIAGEKSYRYLRERYISEDTINRFHLGFVPNAKRDHSYLTKKAILNCFPKAKSPLKVLKKSPVFTSKLYNRFTNRIVFPITDLYNHIVAFSGRTLKKKPNLMKYLNSPDNRFFKRNRSLYNLGPAVKDKQTKHVLFLCEGFFDVISISAAGFHNVVSSFGTSLTFQQVKLLQRITKHVIICYDGDKPGQEAIMRAIRLIHRASRLRISVVKLPSGLDPDEYRVKNGSKQLHHYLATCQQSALSFELDYIISQPVGNNEAHQQFQLIKKSLAIIAQLTTNHIQQSLYLKKLARHFKVSLSSLQAEIAHFKPRNQQALQRRPAYHRSRAPQVLSCLGALEQVVLINILSDRSVYHWAQVSMFQFHSSTAQAVYSAWQKYLAKYPFNREDFIKQLAGTQLQPIAQKASSLVAPHLTKAKFSVLAQAILRLGHLKDQMYKAYHQFASQKQTTYLNRIALLYQKEQHLV